ncbi:VIT domain-containing protein [Sulfurospirillum oryzae]|uniref:VIT domain-containing protein n=1 Tax=Sulfurospirillum oryzae TaxID=2976535 RepID=UPI0021E82D6D|nr:VIT domain-containing protein [Sulfurospirillum oryzae]
MRAFLKVVSVVFVLTHTLFALEAPSIPPLLIVPMAKVPVQINALHVETEVIGAIVTSHVTLTFYNPNNNELEGNLEFPLREGQVIESFALESLDESHTMMPSSAIEKQRGEEVFEAIERRNADPALLSQTVSNNFKLRLYPILPKKQRTIRLDIVETLSPNNSGYFTYYTPLSFEIPSLKKSSFTLSLYGISKENLIKKGMLEESTISALKNGIKINSQKPLSKLTKRPIALWKPSIESHTIVSSFEDERYFVSELPLHWISLSQKPAKNLALIWDASSSGEKRDHAKELALLETYFKQLPKEETSHVSLSIVRNEAEPLLLFDIQGSDWAQLRHVLETIAYDGATNAGAWSVPKELPKSESVALLFSDGLANWKEMSEISSPVPLYTINASPFNNSLFLQQLAESNNGQFLDILTLSKEEALERITRRTTRITNMTGNNVDALVLNSCYPEHGRITISGKLLSDKATLTLTRQNPDGNSINQTFVLHTQDATQHPSFAARQWAKQRITQLEAQSHLHKAEIIRLGKKFGLVTAYTSLIVLENFEEYLRYDVLPPKGQMREAFFEIKARNELNSHAQKSQHLDHLVSRFNDKVLWWGKEFPKEDKKYMPPEEVKASAVTSAPMMAMAVSSAAPMRESMAKSSSVSMSAENPTSSVLSIQLQKYEPNAPYAKRIKEAKPEDRYAIYLDEKPNYAKSTAFYLDVAQIFFENKEETLALRILSNIAEMELENRHILRILAYRLQQMNQFDCALPLLKRVLELSPHEPQSWRDLGLLYAKMGEGQKAVDTLWEVVSTEWESRFADIDLIALGELNALLANSTNLDTSKFDQRLLKNLPVDLRAVLTWDADDSDMDLWVIDPNDEKIYYGHTLSYQGGRISRDFTAGYGPEEFILKKAKKGTYTVKAHFYGTRQQIVTPYTTLMLTLSTAFGTDHQKDEHIILRLKGRSEDVFVGTFTVGE